LKIVYFLKDNKRTDEPNGYSTLNLYFYFLLFILLYLLFLHGNDFAEVAKNLA